MGSVWLFQELGLGKEKVLSERLSWEGGEGGWGYL